jgi:CDP-diacylglycerol---serine O-phosphatidyltransferase
LRSSPFRYCLPAVFTLANLGFGLAAILVALGPTDLTLAEQITLSAWLVIAAMVCDGCDGPLARLLLATSRLGNVADSVADWFSFGLAPAVLICTVGADEEGKPSTAALVVASMYALATLLRLQRHSRRTARRAPRPGGFVGLPSPAAACLALGLVVLESESIVAHEIGHPRALLVFMVAIAVLMVSPARYPKLAALARVWPPQLSMLVTVAVCVLIFALGPWAALLVASSVYAAYPVMRLLFVRASSDDPNMATGGRG